MASVLLLRGHLVHLVIFGIPVAGMVGAVAFQEIRGRMRAGSGTKAPAADRTVFSWVVAAGLLAAAAIHVIAIPEHLREYVPYGVFFATLAVAQAALAFVVVRPTLRRSVLYVGVGSGCVVVLWIMSRTTGLPIGPEPWQSEPASRLDIAATCAELITVAGCIAQLWTTSVHRRPPARRPTALTA